ncbi:Gfo/Idh/MocA family protein [Halocatena halophila]|uniref:Gfo/Idh/MocA family protein n=1 Tax=Halocatena halophila TaxID=2814576 RepID=UPI002ED49852
MSYRAGIIGTGGIAGMGILGMHDESQIGEEKIEASHAGGYASTDGIELVAVADVDAESLDTFGTAWKIPPERRYVGHEAMLESESLDVISICSPSYLHHKHTIDAARSAADPDVIWCEKPIASSVHSAERMIAVCDATDTELCVNHSFRFTKKLQQLYELIHTESLLGPVDSVSTQYRMELLRNATHVLDTLVYLLDVRASSVSGHLINENEAVDSLDVDVALSDSAGGGYVVMDDGTFVTVDCTIPREHSSMTLQFVGANGKLYLNNDDGEWRYWSLEDGEHVERELPGIDGSWTWQDDYTASFTTATQHIVGLLDGTETNRSPGRAAVRSLEILVGFYLSHHLGATVDVPLAEPLGHTTVTSW